jgi:hypothetical protein
MIWLGDLNHRVNLPEVRMLTYADVCGRMLTYADV